MYAQKPIPAATSYTPQDVATLFDELAGAASKRGKIIESNLMHLLQSKPGLFIARNTQGHTPLHTLVQHEEAQWVEKWLQLPAKLKTDYYVPALAEIMFARDSASGQTPLQYAQSEKEMREKEGRSLAGNTPLSRIIDMLQTAEADALLALKTDIATNEQRYYTKRLGANPFHKVLSLSAGPAASDLSSVETIRQMAVEVEDEKGEPVKDALVNVKYFGDGEGKIHTTKSAFGLTPLHIAALLAKEELVKFFAEGGVDLHARCDFALTALDMAQIVTASYRHRMPKYAMIAAYLQSRQRSDLTPVMGTFWRGPAKNKTIAL